MTTRALVLALGLGAFLMGGPAHAATDPAAACKDTKAKTTGKKASALLKAYGKNIKKPDPAKLAGSISKAQSKMTKGFVKAESKGGCATTGDVGAIEAKTDGFAASCIEDIGGATCGNGIKGGSEECDAGGGDGAGPSDDCLSGTCNAGCLCAGCGDGILAGGEDCDEGGANGTSASCCNSDCTLKAASTACDDTDGNVCTTAGCDGVSGDCDQGHISTPASTPCPDTDGDTCTTSGCDGAGACDQGHAQAPNSTPCADIDGNACTTAGCDGVSGCDQNHVFAPNSDPCPDVDGNVCTTAGCDGAGTCDQLHILVPASNPCPDVDGNVCTTAGCDGAGSCNQLHILEPGGTPCGNPADTDCSNPDTCDGLGSCSANDEANSFPCPDTDGNVCTAAGCDGVGGCDQLLGAGQALPMLFAPRLPVDLQRAGHPTVQCRRARSSDQVAFPVGASGAGQSHDFLSVGGPSLTVTEGDPVGTKWAQAATPRWTLTRTPDLEPVSSSAASPQTQR